VSGTCSTPGAKCARSGAAWGWATTVTAA
jgi:hypothetical protein